MSQVGKGNGLSRILFGLAFPVLFLGCAGPAGPVETAGASWNRYLALCQRGSLVEAAIEQEYIVLCLTYADRIESKEGRFSGLITEGMASRLEEPLCAAIDKPANIEQLVMLAECHHVFDPGLMKKVHRALGRMLGKPVGESEAGDTAALHGLLQYYEEHREQLHWDANKDGFVLGLPKVPPGRKLPLGFEPIEGAGVSKDGYPLRIRCLKDNSEMVLVPPGRTLVGGIIQGATRRFYIDRYEVTNSQYRKYTQETGKPFPTYDSFTFGNKVIHEKRPGHDAPLQPVTCIRWDEAMAYAKWAGKSLPTSVEWSHAAYSDGNSEFPWGSGTEIKVSANREDPPINLADLDKLAIMHRVGKDAGPEPVGGRPKGATPFGAEDMVGNVEEYVEDRFDGSPQTCGHWYATNWDYASLRTCYPRSPKGYGIDVGFRCALRLSD